MFAPRIAILDVETTGANPAQDRVTEIAILRLENGEIADRFETLVNPGRPIPPLIEKLIGITDGMVAGAPSFADIAPRVREILDGCVFVAHNARFDYGFLKHEFSLIGEAFDAPVLCTVKLSRALYPQHHRHGLDALIERHGLACSARHRAAGDVEALHGFCRIVAGEFDSVALDAAILRAMKTPARPAGLQEGLLEGLPEAPGAFVLYGEGEAPLRIARAANLRSQLIGFFSGDGGKKKGKDAKLLEAVRRVEWFPTAGELGAQLEEARLAARLPGAKGDGPEHAVGLEYAGPLARGPVLVRRALHGGDPARWDAVSGVFRNRGEADKALADFARLYKLCLRRIGLEPWSAAPCSAFGAKRCGGVCAGRESIAAHDERLRAVLAPLHVKPWPWPGPGVIREHHEASGRRALHLIDRWCVLGTVETEDELVALAAAPPPRRFDAGLYRVLVRALAAKPAAGQALTLLEPLR